MTIKMEKLADNIGAALAGVYILSFGLAVAYFLFMLVEMWVTGAPSIANL